MSNTNVMAMIIETINLMNPPPSAPPHVHLTCLLVKMDQSAFPSQNFAMGTAVVLTIHTFFPPIAKIVLLNICSCVRRVVLIFV